jgi:hypothetical protein
VSVQYLPPRGLWGSGLAVLTVGCYPGAKRT